jgi:predicted transcriptional regulator
MNARISIHDLKKNPQLKAHSKRSRAVAKALDRKSDRLPYSQIMTGYELETFLETLTPKRFELLRIASKGPKSISELAAASNRNHSAVSKDVAKLQGLGLVSVEMASNMGHGLKKVVKLVSSTILLQASIAD